MRLTRAQLIARVDAHPNLHRQQSCYVDTDTGEPDCGADFCFDHANEFAKAFALAEGRDAWVGRAWAESDSSKRCAVCDVALLAGGLTSYGVDSAIGLTETKPKECHVYLSELSDAASAMMPDDPRWVLWEFHARRVLKNRSAT